MILGPSVLDENRGQGAEVVDVVEEEESRLLVEESVSGAVGGEVVN